MFGRDSLWGKGEKGEREADELKRYSFLGHWAVLRIRVMRCCSFLVIAITCRDYLCVVSRIEECLVNYARFSLYVLRQFRIYLIIKCNIFSLVR